MWCNGNGVRTFGKLIELPLKSQVGLVNIFKGDSKHSKFQMWLLFKSQTQKITRFLISVFLFLAEVRNISMSDFRSQK